jgi:hypothetical protein
MFFCFWKGVLYLGGDEMSRSTYYFPHDFNARNDPKLQKLLMKMGQEGKGIYWDLVEMLYEQNGYLPTSECETYAFQLRTTYDSITTVIHSFGLFKMDDDKFWSESVLRRLDERKNKSDKARESVLKRWNDTNEIRTKYERNTKKRKEKKDIYISYHEFYTSELSKIEDTSYHSFVEWLLGKNEIGRPFEKCLGMQDQIGYSQYLLLKRLSQENGTKISDKIRDLENGFEKYKKKSLNLTLVNWMKRK